MFSKVSVFSWAVRSCDLPDHLLMYSPNTIAPQGSMKPLTILILTTAVVACTESSSVVEETRDMMQDPQDIADAATPTGLEGDPCQTRADCAPNLDCGPPLAPLLGCGEGWRCTSEQLCSAAAPNLGCTCDGVALSLSAGCPGQDSAGWLSALDPTEAEGSPCDPNNLEDFRTDVVIDGSGFSAYSGVTTGRVLIIAQRPDGQRVGPIGPFVDANGLFAWDARDFVIPGAPGDWIIQVLADANSDGICDVPSGDAAWRLVVPNPASGDVRASVAVTNAMITSCEGWTE
jgi:hypothetical protein